MSYPATISKIKNGLYVLFWMEGGYSVASVGRLHDGTPWFAPDNWTSKDETGIASTDWESVAYLAPIDATVYIPRIIKVWEVPSSQGQ